MWKRLLVFCLILIGLISIYLIILNRMYPLVGHDYCQFLPRMFDTYLHYQQNGLSLQWHTPSFGGGIPAFPKPQHFQYSFPQLLLTIFNPWLAIQVGIAVSIIIGFIFFFKFSREVLDFEWQTGILGALFFSANGFYIQHMTAGHVTFWGFPLLSVLLYLLFLPKANITISAILVSLFIAMIIYGAGFYISIIFLLTIMISIPLVRLISPENFNLKRTMTISLLGGLGGALLITAKVVAVLSFMSNFPRVVSNYFYTDYGNILAAVMGVVSQLSMSLVFIIMMIQEFIGIAPKNSHADKLFVWTLETDISISPMLILLLLIGVFSFILNIRTMNWKFFRKNSAWLLFLFGGFWIAFEFSTTIGNIYDSVRQLPVLRSLHYNVRNTAAFLVPLTILGMNVFRKKILGEDKEEIKPVFLLFILFTFVFLGVYLLISPTIQDRSCDIEPIKSAYQQNKSGEFFPIDKIADGTDSETFRKYSSNLTPREPIFGYLLENFHINVQPGSVYDMEDGYYNLTNPQGYIDGLENGPALFERFRVEDIDTMEEFLQRKQPDWAFSSLQKTAFGVSYSTFVLLLSALIYIFVKRFLHKNASKKV